MLIILDLLNISAVVSLLGIAVPKFHIAPNPDHKLLTVLGMCIPLHYPNIQPDVWYDYKHLHFPCVDILRLPILIFQTILFVMVIGRHIYLQKREGFLFRNNNTATMTSHVYHIFIRDGVWVFFVVLREFLS